MCSGRPRLSTIAVGLLLFLFGGVPSVGRAQVLHDRNWVPHPAESLQEVSDAIERARADRSTRREREALLRLADRLLDEAPEGGFPIGAGRWIGPGRYLATAVEELSEKLEAAERERFQADLDGKFSARLERVADRAPLERWLRDLPVSQQFDPVRARVNAALLEAGHAESWLDRVQDGWPRGAEIEPSIVARWLRHPTPPTLVLARPWSPRLTARWPIPGDPRSPWRPGAVRVQPVAAGDQLFVATPDGVHCWRVDLAEESWFFPFVADGPPTLPGTVRRPVLCGRTLFVTTERGILGLDRETGSIRFELEGVDLFPRKPRSDSDDPEGRDAPPQEPSGSPILSISPPALSERGAVVAVSRVLAGSLDMRLVLLDPEGRVIWNRDVGSATGATHLALGSVLPAPVPRGDRVTVVTQRGSVLTHSILDGGLLWAAPYSGFDPDGSRDAIRHAARPRDAKVEADEWFVHVTALDAASLQFWRRTDGELYAEIPLGDQRWWGLAPLAEESRPLLILSEDRATPWTVSPNGLRAGAPIALEEGLPRFSGPPIAVADGWWVPHESGVYHLDERGRILEVVDLSPPAAVHNITRIGEGLVISGDGYVELRLPIDSTPGTLSALWGEIARGDLRALPEPLPPVDPSESPASMAEEERIARTILWQLRRPGVDAELRARVTTAAVQRIVLGANRARVAYREAVAAARRGERELAVELVWLALAGQPSDLFVEIEPLGAVPLELAARDILARMRDEEQQLPNQELLESRARLRFARTGAKGSAIERRLEIFEHCPGTAVGRRAALDAAEELYRYGNLGVALQLLEKLLIFEPANAEAVEARFRIAELSREIGDIPRARALLAELERDYGNLSMTIISDGVSRTMTVSQRVEKQRATLPPEDAIRGPGVVTLPLLPVWRIRTELEHLRNLHIHPLDDGSGRFLTISRRSIELREVERGDRIWHRTLPPLAPTDRIPAWSDVGRLSTPIATDAQSVWLTDRREILRISLTDGKIIWSQTLPHFLEEEGDEPALNPVEGSAMGDGVLLAHGGHGELHAFDALSGTPLWHRPTAGPLEGPPQVRDGRVLLGITAPARVEIWSLADGSPIWTFDVESLGTTLAQEPFFIPPEQPGSPSAHESDDDVLVALERGEIRRIDPATDTTVWTHDFPQLLRMVHRPDGFQFWIAEHYWAQDLPSLFGFDPRTGQILWQKTFPAEQRRLHELIAHDGDLYLVEGDFNQRRVICLEVPRAFPHFGDPNSEPRELHTRWKPRLTQSWDVPRLRAHQDWILLEDSLTCDLTILSRESGLTILAREGFESAMEFLKDRQRLYYAGFIGKTLVLFTSRGAMGLRAPDPIRERALEWARLGDLPIGGIEGPSADPVTDAGRAFRAGRTESAVRLLERALDEPGLRPETRRDLLYRIEGLAEELGENTDLEWRVPRLEIPPIVDGSLEEAWNAATAWPIESPRYFHPIQGFGEDGAQWRGERDLSMVLFAAWSDEGFHLALDVSDDSIHPYDRDLAYWNGDCLLLAFDMLGDGGSRRGGDDQLLTLALTVPRRPPPGGAGGGAGAAGAGAAPPAVEEDPEGQYQVQRKGDGSGVIYEVMLPWKVFRKHRQQAALPHPGMAFRLNLVLTDDDGGQRATTYMSLSSGQMLREETSSVWNIFIPERFPRIILGR